jgi:hypothetical protein
VAEVGPEPVVGREPHVVGTGHDDVGDDPALQAAHPISQHDLRDTAEDLEALGQHAQRGGLLLIGGEPDEPEPRPGQHRAEDVDPAASDELLAPVDHQKLTRRPDRRPAATRPGLPESPLPLRGSDQPPEVAVRPRIARRPRGRQQPLRADLPQGLGDLLRDQLGDLVIVPGPRLAHRRRCAGTGGLIGLDDPSHRLVGRTADLGSSPVCAYVSVGGNHVHSFLRVLQWKPLRGAR